MSPQEIHYDRPPEGLQRGLYPAPQWAIAALGAVVMLGSLVLLTLRARRARGAAGRSELQAPRQR